MINVYAIINEEDYYNIENKIDSMHIDWLYLDGIGSNVAVNFTIGNYHGKHEGILLLHSYFKTLSIYEVVEYVD